MAEESSDDPGSKTEEPTQRRLEQALERGQIINSREVTSFFMLVILTMLISWVLPYTYNNIGLILKNMIGNAHDIDISEKGFRYFIIAISAKIFLYSAVPLLAIMIAAILASFVQQGQINFSSDPLMPDLSRISIFSGIKRVFSTRSLIEFIKGLVKISIMFISLYLYIISSLDHFEFYQLLDVNSILERTQHLIDQILLMVCIITASIAVIDYFYQRYEYFKSLMMTKEEVKQEYKQTEGSPEIKQKMRQLRMERVKRGLISQVPTADVIITNPTHYSIALKYDDKNMPAPKLVAKGLDNVAMKIREIAKEHDIPIVENPELARALYKNVKVDEEIPIEYYQAVAKIISYVYKIKGRKNK